MFLVDLRNGYDFIFIDLILLIFEMKINLLYFFYSINNLII
jgi:hypothetical protein